MDINNSYLLHTFLFHLRTPLHSIKGASMLAKHYNEKISIVILDWLKKWEPVIDLWISSEAEAHSLLENGESHDWEKIIFEMAEKMKDVKIACDETKNFPLPESPESEDVISLAKNGIVYLDKVVQLSRDKDYAGLLNQ